MSPIPWPIVYPEFSPDSQWDSMTHSPQHSQHDAFDWPTTTPVAGPSSATFRGPPWTETIELHGLLSTQMYQHVENHYGESDSKQYLFVQSQSPALANSGLPVAVGPSLSPNLWGTLAQSMPKGAFGGDWNGMAPGVHIAPTPMSRNCSTNSVLSSPVYTSSPSTHSEVDDVSLYSPICKSEDELAAFVVAQSPGSHTGQSSPFDPPQVLTEHHMSMHEQVPVMPSSRSIVVPNNGSPLTPRSVEMPLMNPWTNALPTRKKRKRTPYEGANFKCERCKRGFSRQGNLRQYVFRSNRVRCIVSR